MVVLTGMSRNIPTKYNDPFQSDIALGRAGSIEMGNVGNFSPILSACISRSSKIVVEEALIYAV